eukprot:GHVU01078491.1.p1 GENE.GHVU01078491.1~~GHVU01078491.1.p1  ORF type:complete len:186 (+),score=28.98 GHVU01078491.1:427-984(+)
MTSLGRKPEADSVSTYFRRRNPPLRFAEVDSVVLRVRCWPDEVHLHSLLQLRFGPQSSSPTPAVTPPPSEPEGGALLDGEDEALRGEGEDLTIGRRQRGGREEEPRQGRRLHVRVCCVFTLESLAAVARRVAELVGSHPDFQAATVAVELHQIDSSEGKADPQAVATALEVAFSRLAPSSSLIVV